MPTLAYPFDTATWQRQPIVHAGDPFFVKASGGVNSAYGGDKAHPLATLDYAIGLTTANHGDVIYVMPGHTETISTATALALDVAGVQVVGLGHWRLRPTLTLGTAGH